MTYVIYEQLLSNLTKHTGLRWTISTLSQSVIMLHTSPLCKVQSNMFFCRTQNWTCITLNIDLISIICSIFVLTHNFLSLRQESTLHSEKSCDSACYGCWLVGALWFQHEGCRIKQDIRNIPDGCPYSSLISGGAYLVACLCRVSYSGFCSAAGIRHILFWEAQFYPPKER